ncbi:hypothetical protein GGX14DRAFT_458549, partial [Mycena pura]
MPSLFFELSLTGPPSSVIILSTSLQFLGSTTASLRDCVRELGFWSCEGVQGQQCILAHVHFDTSWAPAFLSGTGHVVLPTYLP